MCVCVCVCVCVLSNVPECVCVHRFFSRSSVDGHIGGFHILAAINNTTENIGMHVCF